MKSKKIIAMIVAFAAFMAVATSGFAAVSTTTTYNTVSGMVEVDVDITEASPYSEVTYLVNSGNAIVYIDQRTADGSGNVSFDYKIDKDDMTGIQTEVKYGTNGEVTADSEGFVNSDAQIELNELSVTPGDSTVTLYSDKAASSALTGDVVVGDGDTVYAKVVANSGYEVVKVEIGGVEVAADGGVYEIKGNKAIVVTTEAQQVQTKVDKVTVAGDIDFGAADADAEGAADKEVSITYLKVTGTPSVVGVKVGTTVYQAFSAFDGTSATAQYDATKTYAVRLITNEAIADSEIEAYFE